MTDDKPLRWLAGSLRTPPVGQGARVEAGALLRRLQRGETLGAPRSKPLSVIGPGVHELRINDADSKLTWRIAYRIDRDAVVVVHWWAKKAQRTARRDLELCRRRLHHYDRGSGAKRG